MSETTDQPVSGLVVVTGGTGTLGRFVVAKLREAGRPVRVVSRHAPERAEPGVEHVPADLVTGDGADAAVAGASVIVHCAGNSRGDETMTRNLVQAVARAGSTGTPTGGGRTAAEGSSPAGDGAPETGGPGGAGQAGGPHLVYISVVGADRVPVRSRIDRAMFGYFAAKLAAEKVVTGSGLPYSILRATQFHDLALATVRALAKLPVVPSFSGVRFQPIDAAEVADRLVQIALGEPAGMLPEMGGPEILPMADLVRSYLRATGKRRAVVNVRAPGAAYRAVRNGAILCPDHADGRRTWQEFLSLRPADRA